MKTLLRPLVHVPLRGVQPHRARGMTLIEVLCAILVMTLGLLGLMTLMARASQATLATDDAQRAASLANELATEMWLQGTVTLPSATLTAWNTRLADATGMGLANGAGTVSVGTGNVARITITWTPPGPTPANQRTSRQYFTDVRLNN
ncbi:N-terminal methylation site-containing protein [Roseateles sp. YR242]|uniref:type IV pilus modification PilV family protein n=1 Tax=Roseateles sp. YR242 TaxID=1855305 RepID=UPI0008C21D21|nr:prepilin-type N-terminal cleavage/methylation domain-containing protein [Roseateles sp. YR242]SEL27060.1 N-terminal methylation site-containing protein [Roseateles sp. YR242]